MRFWPLLILVSTAALAQAPGASLNFGSSAGGCSGVIARYRAVQANDLAMGHVAKSVHAQIAREIDAAEKVCAAGDDGQARALIHASEARHGYPTNL